MSVQMEGKIEIGEELRWVGYWKFVSGLNDSPFAFHYKKANFQANFDTKNPNQYWYDLLVGKWDGEFKILLDDGEKGILESFEISISDTDVFNDHSNDNDDRRRRVGSIKTENQRGYNNLFEMNQTPPKFMNVLGIGSNIYGDFEFCGTFDSLKFVLTCIKDYKSQQRPSKKKKNPETQVYEKKVLRKRKSQALSVLQEQEVHEIKDPNYSLLTPKKSSSVTKITPSVNSVSGSKRSRQTSLSDYEVVFKSNDGFKNAFMLPETGEIYEGYIHNGLRDGTGICVYINGNIYEGEWKNDREHGQGILMTGNREVLYEGEFVDGKITGKGTYFFPNSDRYIGEWKENMRHGRGTYIFANGVRYEGEWKDNLRNGKGVMIWPDGSWYDGDWKDDQRYGKGKLSLSSGLWYEGSWSQNIMDGRGTCCYTDNQKYEGPWKIGKKDGRGTLSFSNGATYEGRFKDDEIGGQGTIKIPHAVEGCKENNEDWLIPIEFQSDMEQIHVKAGFNKKGI